MKEQLYESCSFVDVQKDFIDGALRNEKAKEITPKIAEFAKECVKNGYKLYATRDTHKKTEYIDGKDISFYAKSGYLATLEGKKLPVEHCIEGTDGWMIDESLWNVIDGKVTVVNKSTFGSLDLVEVMNEDLPEWYGKHVWTKGLFDEIIIVGFCTSICVLANAVLLRAKFPDTKITVIKDLCACVTEESHNVALKALEMQQIDVV